METKKRILKTAFVLLYMLGCSGISHARSIYPGEATSGKKKYSTYNNFEELLTATDACYFEPVRISPVGTKRNPMYHGFFFYNCGHKELLEFDPSGRYMLGMRIFIEGRKVRPFDKGEVGYFDLKKKNKWIKIGETTAWNWQQGCRLQWIPGSTDEIVWNDRSFDGKKLVSHIYNINTKITRTLPMAIYTVSPDGKTALSINFERIVHGGCKYVGIRDMCENQWAPSGIGIWKMNMENEKTEMLLSVKDIAKIIYPNGMPSDTLGRTLYFFREGFNPSGDRFIFFVKDARETEPGKYESTTKGFSMSSQGGDIKYFYREPSHHFWINDNEIMDNGYHPDPETGDIVRGYFRFVDDATGIPKEKYFDAPNGHITLHKNGEWILTDTYNIHGYIYLYMFHIPTKKIVPLAKLAYKLGGYLYPYNPGIFRVDLHPRFLPNGKSVAIDSSHEGLGRQMYIVDINSIIDNPPD